MACEASNFNFIIMILEVGSVVGRHDGLENGNI